MDPMAFFVALLVLMALLELGGVGMWAKGLDPAQAQKQQGKDRRLLRLCGLSLLLVLLALVVNWTPGMRR